MRKVGFFGYTAFCFDGVKGDVLMNFGNGIVSALLKLGMASLMLNILTIDYNLKNNSTVLYYIFVRLTRFIHLLLVGFVLSIVVSFPLAIFPCRASINSLLAKQVYDMGD